MMNSIQFIGYHGTKSDCAKNICQEKKFRPSGKSSEWLGKGIYFFKDDVLQAYFFAKFRDREDKRIVSVLSANIKTSIYFDMAITKHRDIIERLFYQVCRELKQQNGDLYKYVIDNFPNLVNGLNECSEGYILDIMYKINAYDLVLCPFNVPKKEKIPPFKSSPIHIQVCVKDDTCIEYDSLSEGDRSEYESLSRQIHRKVKRIKR